MSKLQELMVRQTSEAAAGACVQVTRGSGVDAWHAVSVAIVDRSALVASAGDPDLVTFARSTLKPFQAAPLLTSGAAAAFSLSPQELALACASHNGTDEHVRWVQSLLAKAGAREQSLRCGAHWPLGMQAEGRWPLQAEDQQPLRHNCSGKHAGFLLLARHLGVAEEEYLSPAAGVQQQVCAQVAELCGLSAAELVFGVDGCSAPNYALPLRALARGMLRLAAPLAEQERSALLPLRDAMLAHPELVSGEGQFDCELMRAFGGELVCKSGAEGMIAIGLSRAGLGIAIKVHDGGARALGPACLAVLEQLGHLPSAAKQALARYCRPQVYNAAGQCTGEILAQVPLVSA